jgi:hypothetical protein
MPSLCSRLGRQGRSSARTRSSEHRSWGPRLTIGDAAGTESAANGSSCAGVRERGRAASADTGPGVQTPPERHFVRRVFGADIVDIDGAEFIECRFRGTTLRYSGGELPRIIRCSFSDAHFAADGAAAKTVAFLKAMASTDSGLQDVVRETFAGCLRQLRRN